MTTSGNKYVGILIVLAVFCVYMPDRHIGRKVPMMLSNKVANYHHLNLDVKPVVIPSSV